MYVPRLYALNDDESWSIVSTAGAGFLVAATSSGLRSVFAPVLVDDDRRTLRAHVARANPWWRSVTDGDEVTALFNAANAYVSPNLYPTKLEHPEVAPTWNYLVAEVTGRVRVRDDAAWSEQVVRGLTTQFESTQSEPWSVDDAPAAFVSRLVGAIVGVEIEVHSISASAKLSQNQPEVNHDNVRDRFVEGSLREQQVAAQMKAPQ